MERLKITISLAEYFSSLKGRNVMFATIDDNRAKEIMGQEGWSEIVKLEPINHLDNSFSGLWQLWKLEEYKANSAGVIERRNKEAAEKTFVNFLETQKHTEFEEKRNKAIEWLIAKGKQKSEAIKIVVNAITPRIEEIRDFDPDTLEEKITRKTNEIDLKYRKAFGFDLLLDKGE